MLRTCPFVLSNQWGLWSLYGPDSVFFWSNLLIICARGLMALLISHAPTQIIWVWAVERHSQKISGVSCLLKTSKREAFMRRQRWVARVAIKLKISFQSESYPEGSSQDVVLFFALLCLFSLKEKNDLQTMSHSYLHASVRKSMIPFSLLRALQGWV